VEIKNSAQGNAKNVHVSGGGSSEGGKKGSRTLINGSWTCRVLMTFLKTYPFGMGRTYLNGMDRMQAAKVRGVPPIFREPSFA
jgi:hypothetical protein